MNTTVKQIKEQGLVAGKSYQLFGVGNLFEIKGSIARFIDKHLHQFVDLPVGDMDIEVIDAPTVAVIEFQDVTKQGGKAIARVDGKQVESVYCSYPFASIEDAKKNLRDSITRRLPSHIVVLG